MSLIFDFFKFLIELFPDDPFLSLLADFKGAEWLGYLNFFLPISFMVNSTMIWVAAVTTYRIIKVLVNFIQKLIK